MKYCIYCGSPLPDDVNYCSQCGKKCFQPLVKNIQQSEELPREQIPSVPPRSSAPEPTKTTKTGVNKSQTSRKDVSPKVESTSQIWYYSVNGNQNGEPIEETALQTMAEEGKLTGRTMVREEFAQYMHSIQASKFAKYLPKSQQLSYIPAFLVVLFFVLGNLSLLNGVSSLINQMYNSYISSALSFIILLLSIVGLIGQGVAWLIDIRKLNTVAQKENWVYWGILNIILTVISVILGIVAPELILSLSFYIDIWLYRIVFTILDILYLIGPTIYIFSREKYTYHKHWGSILICCFDVIVGIQLLLNII